MDLIEQYGIENLVCTHGHRYNTGHNSCFKKGKVKLAKSALSTWYSMENLRVGYLDIEADGLKTDFCTMLSWCIKDRDGKIFSNVITKKELFELEDRADKRIVEELVKMMQQFDIIVTFYGAGYDIPFIRSKAYHYNIPFPEFSIHAEIKKDGSLKHRAKPLAFHFDLYYTVKTKFATLSRKSLDNVCYWLGIEGKTPLDKTTWAKAKYGNPEALAKVLEHNEGDVIILEELHKRIEGITKWSKNPL